MTEITEVALCVCCDENVCTWKNTP